MQKKLKLRVLCTVIVVIGLLLTTGVVIAEYNEAPELKKQVEEGELPPIEERLPSEPLVVEPHEDIGEYGGTIRNAYVGAWRPEFKSETRWSYTHLVRFDHTQTEVVPHLAKDWDISEDGKTITLYLREGVRWSDGEEWTADDVLFAWDSIAMNKDLHPVFPEHLKRDGEPAEVVKLDDYTLQFKFKAPYIRFVEVLASAAANYPNLARQPKHYLEKFHPDYRDQDELEEEYEEAGFDNWYEYFEDRNRVIRPERPRLSPWVSVTEPPADKVKFKRNPYYWKVDPEGNQLPYIDSQQFDVVNDAEIVAMQAIEGRIDLQRIHLHWKQIPVLSQAQDEGNLNLLRLTADRTNALAMSLNQGHEDPVKREIFEDKRFRYALSHAIDREAVSNIAYLGSIEYISQPLPNKNSPYHYPPAAFEGIEYDPDKAETLLDEMGLDKKDEEGYRLRPDGERLVINFEFALGEGFEDPLEMVADYWEEVGIRTTLDPSERSLYENRRDEPDFDAGTWSGGNNYVPILVESHYIPTSPDWRLWKNQYALWYQSDGEEGVEPPEEVDKLMQIWDRIKSSTSFEEQEELWEEIMKLYEENLWILGIGMTAPDPIVVNPDLRNLPPEDEWVYGWQNMWPSNGDVAQMYFDQ